MSLNHRMTQLWNSSTLLHFCHLGRRRTYWTESTADWTTQYTTLFHPTASPPTCDPYQSSTTSWYIWLSSLWKVRLRSEEGSTTGPWGWCCEIMSWYQSPVSEIVGDYSQSEWKFFCLTITVVCTLLSRPVISRRRDAVTECHRRRREKCTRTDSTWPFTGRQVLWNTDQLQKPQMTRCRSSEPLCWEYW